MHIRQETEADHPQVYRLVKAAFAGAEHADGNEQDLVVALRGSRAFVPELSLVAEEDGEIIGYILFTEIKLGGRTELALAPLAVLPERQRQGVGMALMEHGHAAAKALGYRLSVVLGSDRYYPKAGYVPACRYGISAPFDVPPEHFMAKELAPFEGPVNATVQYAPEFGIG